MSPAATKAALQAAASEQFARHGFAGATLVDIAARAGFTTGAFYRHFPVKGAVLDALFQELDLALVRGLRDADDVAGAASAWIAAARHNRGAVRASHELSRLGVPFLDVRERARARWVTLLERVVPPAREPIKRSVVAAVLVDALDYWTYSEVLGWPTPRNGNEIGAVVAQLLKEGLYGHAGTHEPVGGPAVVSARSDADHGSVLAASVADDARPGTRRAQERIAQIQAAAIRVFDRLGFERTTVLLIANEAGVSNGTVYRYFTDKADIFRSLLLSVEQDLRQLVRVDDSGRMAPRASVTASLTVHRRYGAIYRVWREMLEPGNEFERAWAAMHDRLQSAVADVVVAGQARGVVDTRLDPRLVAVLLEAMVVQSTHTRLDLGWGPDITDEDVVNLLDAVMGRGLRVAS